MYWLLTAAVLAPILFAIGLSVWALLARDDYPEAGCPKCAGPMDVNDECPFCREKEKADRHASC